MSIDGMNLQTSYVSLLSSASSSCGAVVVALFAAAEDDIMVLPVPALSRSHKVSLVSSS
jgi:hypothetical protein